MLKIPYVVKSLSSKAISFLKSAFHFQDLWIYVGSLTASCTIYFCHNYVIALWIGFSVTRFGEILPLWHKLKCLGQFYVGLFSIWHKLLLTSVNIAYKWEIFHGCKRKNNENYTSHLVTLIGFLRILSIFAPVWYFVSSWWAVWPDWAIYWTLGSFLKPLATIDLPQSPPFLGNFFVKVSKSIIFLVTSLLGNFYRYLAIFSGHTVDESRHSAKKLGNLFCQNNKRQDKTKCWAEILSFKRFLRCFSIFKDFKTQPLFVYFRSFQI